MRSTNNHGRRATLLVVAATRVHVTTSIQENATASCGGSNASVRSEDTLEEFLAREHDFTIPDGTPIVRFDTTDGEVWSAFFNQGPADDGSLEPGTIQLRGRPAQPYEGQHWNTLTGYYVYALLAEQAGMVVERVTTRRP